MTQIIYISTEISFIQPHHDLINQQYFPFNLTDTWTRSTTLCGITKAQWVNELISNEDALPVKTHFRSCCSKMSEDFCLHSGSVCHLLSQAAFCQACTPMLGGLNSSPPGQNGRHFTGDIFKSIFLNENVSISILISLKFVPNGLIDNTAALVWVMTWRWTGDKPLPEPMLTHFTEVGWGSPKWKLNTMPQMQQSVLTLVMTLTLDFQGQIFNSFDHVHDLDYVFSRSNFQIAVSPEWVGWLTLYKRDVSRSFMTMTGGSMDSEVEVPCIIYPLKLRRDPSVTNYLHPGDAS